MSFFAVLLALILEQARPMKRGNFLYLAFRAWIRWSARNLDAGRKQHAWIAWAVAAAAPAALSFAIYFLLGRVHVLLAFAWSVLVLYTTLGFRQFSHYFTDIRDALEDADEPRARQLLARWRQVDTSDLPRSEIVRHVIEYSVLSAHRHVFGVLTWFSLLAAVGLGPTGAILYRLTEFVARYWAHKSKTRSTAVSPALRQAAARAWGLIDFLPARLTALAFAVVGSFEEAVDCWRNYSERFPKASERRNDGVILAATSGAMNVRLGGKSLQTDAGSSDFQPFAPTDSGSFSDGAVELMPGREPQIGHLRSVVGLVWRSVVLWMVLLALLTLARLLG